MVSRISDAFGLGRNWSRQLVALVSLALLASSWPGPAAADDTPAGEAERLSASFRRAVKRIAPAVVTVRPVGVPLPFLPAPGFEPIDPDGPAAPRDAGGSGVVVDAAKGYILTNDHVIQGASRVVVASPGGRERPAIEIRRDPKSDLALLVVAPEGLVGADWGDSDALDVGDWVLAIGQPFGLSGTVTAGIVGGKGRGIGLALYEDLIQTDAAINPGNSGGPLTNLAGEVVGINTAIKTLRGGYEGVGFAVPAARARRVATELAEFGRVRRSYLGVSVRQVAAEVAARIDRDAAIEVAGLAPDGPAAAAGVRPGDLLLTVSGRAVSQPGPLQAIVEFAAPDEPLEVVVDRAGTRLTFAIRPQIQPASFGLPAPPSPAVPDFGPIEGGRRRVEPPLEELPAPVEIPPVAEPGTREPSRFADLGLRLAEPTPALLLKYGLNPEARGVLVRGVDPDGPADRGGIEIGMLITDAGHRKVESLAEFRAAATRRGEGQDLVISILKNAKREFRIIPGPAAAGRPVEPGPP